MISNASLRESAPSDGISVARASRPRTHRRDGGLAGLFGCTLGPNNTLCRRGIAILAFVLAMLVIGSFVLWLFQLTASTSTSSLAHYFSTGAFYAAESGLEMAIRELNQTNDFDSDGTIGTISDNGSAADDPALVSGAVLVQQFSASPPLYRAMGRPVQTAAPWSTFTRTIEARVE